MGIGEIAQKAEAVKGAARSTSAAPPATARGAGTSSDAQNSGISARVMQTGAGTLALIAAGVIIVAVGGYHAYKGASRNFLDDLRGTSSDLARPLRMVGYIAKGLTIAGAGIVNSGQPPAGRRNQTAPGRSRGRSYVWSGSALAPDRDRGDLLVTSSSSSSSTSSLASAGGEHTGAEQNAAAPTQTAGNSAHIEPADRSRPS